MKLRWAAFFAGLVIAGGILAFGARTLVHAWSFPIYGRNANIGYFYGGLDTFGTNIFPTDSDTPGCAAAGGNAIPDAVNTTQEFINFILCKLNSTNNYAPYRAQEKTGAAFIIQTMIGNVGSPGLHSPTAQQISIWENRLWFTTEMNKIVWNTTYSYTLNTYYQGTGGGGSDPDDDAFYANAGSAPAIVFENSAGTVVYAIRRPCGNPVGNGQPAGLQAAPNFHMNGYVTPSVTTAAPGATVHFYYHLQNTGTASTSPLNIWWIGQDTLNANATTAGSAAAGVPPFAASEDRQVGDEPVVVPVGVTQICRRIGWSPVDTSGITTAYSSQVCINVLNVTTSCGGMTVNPTAIGPGDSYSLSGLVLTTGGLAGAQSVDNLAGEQFYINVTGPGGSGYSSNNPAVPTTDGSSGSNGTITGTVSPPASSVAGVYTVTYGLSGPIVVNCPSSTFTIAYSPYFAVTGGDIAAGPGFGRACTPGLSQILGNNAGASAGYYGASTQLGAFALGTITGFASDTSRNTTTGVGSSTAGGSATPPSGLTFSNVGAAPNWGKSYGKNLTFCVPDYAGVALAATPAPIQITPGSGTYLLDQTTLNGLVSGQTYVINGNLQTSGALVLGGTAPLRVTFVVKGQAYLNSPSITYASYNYVSGTSTASAVPQFRVLVQGGNIFIDENVQTLTGIYSAEGSGNSGSIFTCASGYNYLTYTSGDTAAWYKWDTNYYADCDTGLNVFGSLAARHIMFNRSGGHLKLGAGVGIGAAEKIVYTPELWLGSVSGGLAPGFDAITSLPPIL